MNNQYTIYKRIDCAIAFKGLQAQWIWWLAAGILGLLFLFAVLYILAVPLLICLVLDLILGTVLFVSVFRLSKRYGEFGLKKKAAFRLMPKQIKGCLLT